ncbi:hypothetical protein HanXRQr2_Chr10g0448051 [Helianthus annuus]|uniref:Uncharacterized protein n=1 Tax=Helianthus annuus TaxID=4232 RepID=A0A251TKP8_HELAN|nr:hypothetical protein HanXRQr2_Chr10g0448051 [Helianthus annuus]
MFGSFGNKKPSLFKRKKIHMWFNCRCWSVALVTQWWFEIAAMVATAMGGE